MPRVKIEIPNHKPLYSDTIKIRITDINYGNHLANDAVLSLTHEIRVRFLQNFGYTEMNISEETSIIMADAAIQFLAEAFYGDILHVDCYIDDVQRSSFDIIYHFFKDENKSIALVKTGIVAFDYQNRKVKAVPKSFLSSMGLQGKM